jgi:Uma2 family endonuclease
MTAPMTFADLERMPDSNRRYEPRHGDLVELAPPKQEHLLIQRGLRRVLEKAAGGAGEVEIEVGFRPTPEHEYWKADVAFVSSERWLAIPRRGNLQGAPDLAIEVLSPSNTASEILDKEQICLENGAREFWVVDPIRRQVKVSGADGYAATYKPGSPSRCRLEDRLAGPCRLIRYSSEA